VSLPELPLLAVLPGTGWLTRVTDSARCAATTPMCSDHEEGSRASAPIDWRLVDEMVPGSKLEETVAKRAKESPPDRAVQRMQSIALTPLARARSADAVDYAACRSSPSRRRAGERSERSGRPPLRCAR